MVEELTEKETDSIAPDIEEELKLAEKNKRWWHKYILSNEGMNAAEKGFSKENQFQFKGHVHWGKAALLAVVPASIGYIYHRNQNRDMEPHPYASHVDRLHAQQDTQSIDAGYTM